VSEWIRLRPPYEKYSINTGTMTLKTNAALKKVGDGSFVRTKGKLLNKSPDGTYSLKSSFDNKENKWHPITIWNCGVNGMKWPDQKQN